MGSTCFKTRRVNMSDLRKEINDLKSLIGNLQLGNGGRGVSRRSRSRSRGRGSGTRATNNNNPTNNNGRRNSRTRNNSRSRNIPGAYMGGPSSSGSGNNFSARLTMGQVHTRARELAGTYTAKAGKSSGGYVIDVRVGQKGYFYSMGAQLNKLALMYEEYTFQSVKFFWEPLVGTTSAGAITIAIAPTDIRKTSTTADALTEAIVVSTQPNKTGRIFERVAITVPNSYLHQKRWWPITNGDQTPEVGSYPASVIFWVDHAAPANDTPLGKFWCEYSVTLQGMTVNDK